MEVMYFLKCIVTYFFFLLFEDSLGNVQFYKENSSSPSAFSVTYAFEECFRKFQEKNYSILVSDNYMRN